MDVNSSHTKFYVERAKIQNLLRLNFLMVWRVRPLLHLRLPSHNPLTQSSHLSRPRKPIPPPSRESLVAFSQHPNRPGPNTVPGRVPPLPLGRGKTVRCSRRRASSMRLMVSTMWLSAGSMTNVCYVGGRCRWHGCFRNTVAFGAGGAHLSVVRVIPGGPIGRGRGEGPRAHSVVSF